MLRTLFSLFFIASVALSSRSQSLEIFLDYKRFYSPESKGILEIYLQVNSGSVMMKSSGSGTYHSSVEIIEIIHHADSIYSFTKKVLNSPAMTDSTFTDFIDQQRFFLPEGFYEVEIIARDLNLENAKPISTRFPVQIQVVPAQLSFSDIQQLERFSKTEVQGPLTKSGYDLIPFVSKYFTTDIDKLAYYAEIYNSSSGADDKFILNQYITNKEGDVLSEYFKFSKQDAKKVIPVIGVFDISKLKTGNYFLVLEARDKNNKIINTTKMEFFRSNYMMETVNTDFLKIDIRATFVDKITSEDSLNEFISCLRPIATPSEMMMIDTIVFKQNDLLTKQKFFFSFWLSRDQKTPDYAWNKYKTAVDDVQRMFGTPIKKGYMTDRGIIFLKYGAPDDVMDRPNEPSSYPYQIWHYHKLAQFSNKRFVFYMPDLVTNEYVMLHSDVPGEVKNYRWEQILHSRDSPNIEIDNGSGGNRNHWGGNSGEFFKNPR
jgi:GWxTD domain-containing protein